MCCEQDGYIYAKVWGFVPADSVELKSEREKVDYRRLIADGAYFACGDSVIGYDFVEKALRSAYRRNTGLRLCN